MNDDIRNMRDGDELDHLIATELLGWEYRPRFEGDTTGYYGQFISEEVPAFSSSMDDALMWVGETVRAHGLHIKMHVEADGFFLVEVGRPHCWTRSVSLNALEKPAAGLCRAALIAKRHPSLWQPTTA